MQLKMALQGRPLSCLGEAKLLPMKDYDSGDIMKLLSQLLHMCSLAKRSALNEIVAIRAMRWTLEKGLSRYLALVLTEYSAPLRSKGKYSAAARYAAIVKRIFERFASEQKEGVEGIRTSDFLMSEFIVRLHTLICLFVRSYFCSQTSLFLFLSHARSSSYLFLVLILLLFLGLQLHAGMLPLQDHPYCDSLEPYLEIYRHALARGAVETAFSSAMHFPLTYFACGRPLNALLDAKLVLFHDKATQLKLHGFAALFHCSRQVLYNLQGKKNRNVLGVVSVQADPTEILDENSILSKMEGRTKSMTMRDFGIYRMFLACIFGDLDAMERMMDRLEGSPLFDLSLARQNLRFTYCGIAAYLLARDGRNAKKNLKTAQDIVKELKKLDSVDCKASHFPKGGGKDSGCVNVYPIILCLTAVERNKEADYVAAIEACDKMQLLPLKALMNELCGLQFLAESGTEKGKPPPAPRSGPTASRLQRKMPRYLRHSHSSADSSESEQQLDPGKAYLGKAMWLYQDWGAIAKVQSMKQQFDFLSSLSRRAAKMAVGGGNSSVTSQFSNESGSRQTRFSSYFPESHNMSYATTSECESILSAESS
mmetsp:Transcript_10287/g.16452  ORF Transcript_10287/g.16452 Transcript_10287/m.16452 type:complete len:594 (+) Transcript_10287:340-2121(+)